MKVLVVAAHPDDEVLGCGGTIAKHADQGDEVNILIAAEGATSRQQVRDREKANEELQRLKESAEKSCLILGAKGIIFLNLPDNRLDSMDRLDVIKAVEEKIYSYKPQIVYLHHSGDVNIDHRILHEAVVTACRPLPNHPVKQLMSFEVASSTEWQPQNSAPGFFPNKFVDISDQLDKKCEALKAYISEMRQWPHPRSIEAVVHQNRWRGAQVGVQAAEAFCLLRELQ